MTLKGFCMKELIRPLPRRCGFELVRYRLIEGKPPRRRDLSDADCILDKIAARAMTSAGRWVVDEYRAGFAEKYFLCRADYTCRSVVK